MGPFYQGVPRLPEIGFPMGYTPPAMAGAASVTTELPPAIVTQIPEQTFSSRSSAGTFPTGSFPPKSNNDWSTPSWSTPSQRASTPISTIMERRENFSRQRSRTTSCSGDTRRRFPVVNQDRTKDVAELKQLLSEPDFSMGEPDESSWKNAQRYSHPGDFDAQKHPSPVVSGPPPKVITSFPRPPLVPENSPWFGAEEQAMLSEFYKSHPFSQRQPDVNKNITPQSSFLNPESPNPFPQIPANQQTQLSPLATNSVQSAEIPHPLNPQQMQNFTYPSNIQSPLMSPVVSRATNTPNDVNPENVVFLRNYNGSQFTQMQQNSPVTPNITDFYRNKGIMKPAPHPLVQSAHQFQNTPTTEYLRTNECAKASSVSLQNPQLPKSDYARNEAMQALGVPSLLIPYNPGAVNPQFVPFNAMPGMRAPLPIVPLPGNMIPPHMLRRSVSPPRQRPGPNSYVRLKDQPMTPGWSLSEQTYQPPSQQPMLPVSLLPLPIVPAAPPPGSSTGVFPTRPVTPQNEPRRFKPAHWPASVMFVPGVPPKPQDKMPPPPKPSPEPPRFMPKASGQPINAAQAPPTNAYPGNQGEMNQKYQDFRRL